MGIGEGNSVGVVVGTAVGKSSDGAGVEYGVPWKPGMIVLNMAHASKARAYPPLQICSRA